MWQHSVHVRSVKIGVLYAAVIGIAWRGDFMIMITAYGSTDLWHRHGTGMAWHRYGMAQAWHRHGMAQVWHRYGSTDLCQASHPY